MQKFPLFLLAALLLAGCDHSVKEKEPEPGTFTVSLPGSATAEAQTVSVKVSCDISWKAALKESASWARLTQKEGEALLALSFNPEDASRSLTLVITAGKVEKSVSITQEGLTSVVKPLSLELGGTAPGRLDIRLKQDWEASCEADWLSLTREQGSGNIVRLIVTPADANENVGERSATVVIKTGAETISVPVTQVQTDVINTDGNILYSNALDGNRSFSVTTNVDFSVEIPSTVKWIQLVEVKSLNSGEIILHLDENRTGKLREAELTLKHGSMTRKVTVKQMYRHDILDKTAPGAYGILDEDYPYTAGTDQWSWRTGAEWASFRILSPEKKQVLGISDIPATLQYNDNFTVSVTLQDGIYTKGPVQVQVTVVDLENGRICLAASDSGKGIIVKKEDL